MNHKGWLVWAGLAALLLAVAGSTRPATRYLGPPTPAPCGCQPVPGYSPR